MNIERSIDILTIHKENLSNAKTFEEYRDVHIAYIDMLIGQFQLDLAKDEIVVKWAEYTAPKEDKSE